ncbi:TPA: hypothetical protein OUB70_001714 [Enterococcus faecalis]|nr:hypothetical protein [Enterococcus faecalis]
MNLKKRKIETILSDVTDNFSKNELILSTSDGENLSESIAFSYELAMHCFGKNKKALIVKLNLAEMERLDFMLDELLNFDIEINVNHYFDELNLTQLPYEINELASSRNEEFRINSYDLIIYHITDGIKELTHSDSFSFGNKNLLLLVKNNKLTQKHLLSLINKKKCFDKCFIVRF